VWQQHLLCASCGILCRGTDELLSTGRRIRPSLRRSSNYCTKQQAENERDRALIQYLNEQGVLMTPWRFYFGCYIDTLCGRTLRNRMSGAAARHFFFLEKVRTVSACIGINLPLKKRPADGGEQPTPPLAARAPASRPTVRGPRRSSRDFCLIAVPVLKRRIDHDTERKSQARSRLP